MNTQVPANVKEARQWIANWRSNQGGAQATSSSSSAKPAAAPAAAAAPKPSSSSDSNGAPVPANVQEARDWIANWRAKQGIGSGAGASAGQTQQQQQQQQGSDVEVVEQEDIMASVTKFFQGFGGKN
jgi:hypothetical protein